MTKDIAPVNRASPRSEVSVNRKRGLNGCHIRRLSDPRCRLRAKREMNGCGNQEARDHDHPEMNRTVNFPLFFHNFRGLTLITRARSGVTAEQCSRRHVTRMNTWSEDRFPHMPERAANCRRLGSPTTASELRSGPYSRTSGLREHTAMPFAKRTSVIPCAQEGLPRRRSVSACLARKMTQNKPQGLSWPSRCHDQRHETLKTTQSGRALAAM